VSIRCTRTTLDIDDDVLQAAKEIARREKKTAGEVVSMLARGALSAPRGAQAAGEPRAMYGFRPFAPHGAIVTNDLIDSLREDDAY
jgi:Arc/MetJ family transcription regulator